MLRVLSVEEMKKIDRDSIFGDIDIGYKYLLKAAKGLSFEISKRVSREKSILFVCGKGNNGGDGFAAAQYLLEDDFNVSCFLLSKKNNLSGEAKKAFEDYTGPVKEITSPADFSLFSEFDIIVDCLLGVGLNGEPRGIYRDAVVAINRSDKFVISADVPSGLDCSGFCANGVTVRADVTVTMGFVKEPMLHYPLRKFVGEIVTVPLDYPEEIVLKNFSNRYLATFSDALNMPPRIADGSKIDHGQLLTVGGSRGMLGALELLSRSSLRCGCGMVHSAVADSLVDVFSSKVTEPVIHPVDDTKTGAIAESSFNKIIELANRCNAAVIGPGLSSNSESATLVRKLVANLTIPTLLDADGINAFCGRSEELKNHSADLIITPHFGEFKRLFPEVIKIQGKNYVELVNQFLIKKTEELDITILLKGNPTRVVDALGNTAFYDWGTSALATAGSGDVLSGIIGSLLAQGSTIKDALSSALYIHATSGSIAAKKLSEYSVIASDILESISSAIKSLTNNFCML